MYYCYTCTPPPLSVTILCSYGNLLFCPYKLSIRFTKKHDKQGQAMASQPFCDSAHALFIFYFSSFCLLCTTQIFNLITLQHVCFDWTGIFISLRQTQTEGELLMFVWCIIILRIVWVDVAFRLVLISSLVDLKFCDCVVWLLSKICLYLHRWHCEFNPLRYRNQRH